MTRRNPHQPLLLAFALCVAFVAAGSAASAQETLEGHGRLLVIANHDNTEVQINGVAYPYEWIYGDMEGVLLPAGRLLEIVVSTDPEHRRTFRFRLQEDETRVLVVDIANMGSAPARAPITATSRTADRDDDDDEEEDDDVGYLGVSSSPRGIVHVDGQDTGERTPARRIPLDPGRHEVQIYYDDDDIMSETKHVLIRTGVNTNVFFRLRREQLEASDDD